VQDRYVLSKAAPDITLTLMSPCPGKITAPGELTLQPAGVKVLFDAQSLKATTEEIPITDGRLLGSWGNKLYRILLKSDKPGMQGDWSMRIKLA
jgi:hypothetical protein